MMCSFEIEVAYGETYTSAVRGKAEFHRLSPRNP